MTPEAQIAIAEFCGWTDIKDCSCKKVPRGTHAASDREGHLLDYCKDRNAMAEAKACLNAPQRVAFVAELEMICEGAICFATAAEEAEAFLRAIRGTKPANQPA